MISQTHTANWMRRLADYYYTVRATHADDRLIVLFNIDGTIVDLRHTVLSLLASACGENLHRAPEPGIKGVAQTVSEEIEGQNGESDQQPGIHDHPPYRI